MLDRTPLQPLLRHTRPLLLQGPMGPFFARLARFLEQHGQTVHKVNFNGGDKLFFRGPRAVSYTGTEQSWPSWLDSFVMLNRIDAIVLFGQMRWMHVAANQLARSAGIAVYVFEEGYVRPDFVTLERGGVNGHSELPKDGEFYRRQPAFTVARAKPTGQRFRQMAAFAVAYNVAAILCCPKFFHYRHHRPLHPLREGYRWIRGGLRKLQRQWVERGILRELTSPECSKQWFLLPLQVHNDSQVRHHSRYASMESVIEEVVASFARFALPSHALVIKHHPMDRAYRNYARRIDELVQAHGLAGRVHYIHDQHLPTLLKHARGVVTLNSTAGLQALFHGAPVRTLGDCMYAVRGLVSDRPLDAFWRDPGKVDMNLYVRFRNYLVRQTQLNASFYGDAPALATPIVRIPAAQPDTVPMPARPLHAWHAATPSPAAATFGTEKEAA